jgi:hypothetical protein
MITQLAQSFLKAAFMGAFVYGLFRAWSARCQGLVAMAQELALAMINVALSLVLFVLLCAGFIWVFN